MHKLLYLFIGFQWIFHLTQGQIIRFGSKLDGTGNLVMVDTVFRLETTPQSVYVKLFSKTPIIEDTLLVIVKNFHVSNKFYMKRSINKMDALATLKFKEDGIYKVFVINPKTKQTLASKRLYITSAVNPNVQALINHQKQLQAQAKTNSNSTKPNVSVNPPKNNNAPKNNTVVSSNTTTNHAQNHSVKPTAPKDDFEDFGEDDVDSDMDIEDKSAEAELDMKEDDLSDFDDAD